MKLEYIRYPKSYYFDPNRKVKGSLTVLTNATAAGTLDFSITTALGTYQLTAPLAAVTVSINESKYVIAKALYDAIQADTALPASIKNYTTLSGNTVSMGQNGYDVTAFSSVITGACVTTSTVFNSTASDVNIELPDQQRKEVVEQAVRIYLERVTDVRWKSYLSEEAIREQSKK
jgi:hypothetical protein